MEGVVDGVAFGNVSVVAKALAKDVAVDAVVVKKVDELSGFGSDVEGVVSAASAEDDGGYRC